MKTTISQLRNLFNKLVKRKQKRHVPIIRITPETMNQYLLNTHAMAAIENMSASAGFVQPPAAIESWTELKKAAMALQEGLDKYELHRQTIRRKNYAALRRVASQPLWILRKVQLAFWMLF